MIPRIKNNFVRPSGTGKTWNIDMDPLPTKFDNYFVESCRSAEEIYDLKQGKLHLMYSGGLDSEHALSIFLHMGMDVTPVIVKLKDYNNHDTNYAFKFCEKKNIQPLVIDIDFDNFVESGKLADVNNIVRSRVFGRATTCYALGKLDGSVVCGEGDPHISKDEETGIWYFSMAEHDYSLENYMDTYGIDGTAFFNGYRPEQAAAYLVDPRMRDLADNKVPGKLGSYSSKHIMYNRHSNFDLEPRQKYHGFEKILDTPIANHPDFQACLNLTNDVDFNGHWQVKYYDLIKDLI